MIWRPTLVRTAADLRAEAPANPKASTSRVRPLAKEGVGATLENTASAGDGPLYDFAEPV